MTSNNRISEFNNFISEEIREHINSAEDLILQKEKIIYIAEHLSNLFKNKQKLIICGNGGSAADAQHFSSELVGRFEKERPGFPAFSLTTDTSALTSIGNDYGFDNIFSRQIESIGLEGDSLIVISTSGNSKNLINAVQTAKNKKLYVIGLLGNQGGKIKNEANFNLVIPHKKTSRIQEMHGLVIHMICKLIDLRLEI